jgi:hypothetical protein
MIHALVTRLSDEALTSRLPRGLSKAVLYISHRSADAELRDDPFVQELVASAPDAAFFACDVRGIGDSQPDTCGANQFLGRYGSHYFYAAYSQMLDRRCSASAPLTCCASSSFSPLPVTRRFTRRPMAGARCPPPLPPCSAARSNR